MLYALDFLQIAMSYFSLKIQFAVQHVQIDLDWELHEFLGSK
jgi:hypothetical protein